MFLSVVINASGPGNKKRKTTTHQGEGQTPAILHQFFRGSHRPAICEWEEAGGTFMLIQIKNKKGVCFLVTTFCVCVCVSIALKPPPPNPLFPPSLLHPDLVFCGFDSSKVLWHQNEGNRFLFYFFCSVCLNKMWKCLFFKASRRRLAQTSAVYRCGPRLFASRRNRRRRCWQSVVFTPRAGAPSYFWSPTFIQPLFSLMPAGRFVFHVTFKMVKSAKRKKNHLHLLV